ncbi:MAG: T9SS type A sorting domain-containing protein, partial [Flavobacteriales bacterium]|nr:T9SS type A sorting domain-containing protein [Flavobacteriales bacterium]
LEDYIDETKELISDALDEDPNKYFTISQFNTSIESDITVTGGFGDETVIPGLKSFITSRGETVTNQLSDHDHSCTTVSLDEEEPADEYLIYPNPSETGVFTLRSSGGIEQIQVYSMVGSLVFSMSNIGDNEFQLDLSEQKSGMYMVQISDQETETLLKIVKQ